jgi:SAM-dependent methyltransferase
MLTVDFDRLGLRPGERALDMGCGAGRHAFEMFRRGADVVALDQDADELAGVGEMFAAMRAAGEVPVSAEADVKQGDALALPFADGEFDRVVAAEVLEHIGDDRAAVAELARVLRPGGTMAVTVPRWLPERICWALSDAYHQVEGGHLRIYTRTALASRLEGAGLVVEGHAHAHGLHSPYWWLRCLVGVDRDDHPLVRAYHQVLVWDIVGKPGVSALTRVTGRLLDPVVGKSLVLYLRKPSAG